MSSEVRIGVIGDVHAKRTVLDEVLDGLSKVELDAVLLVGDIGSLLPARRPPKPGELRRYLRSVEGVLESARKLGVPSYFVPGNHDLRDLDIAGNVDRRQALVGDVRVVGLGGSPDYRGDPYEFDDEAVAKETLPAWDLLLAHTPPWMTPLDAVPRKEKHAGSRAVRAHAAKGSGMLVCGHIHESPSICRIGDTLCMNVGGLGRPFGKAQFGVVAWTAGAWSASYQNLVTGEGLTHTLESAPDATAEVSLF